MPKLRAPVDSLRDVQRHLTVFRSRLLKTDKNDSNDSIAAKINQVMTTIDTIINSLPQEDKSSSDKIISFELDLINKEVKKNAPKIDYRAAVRAMCNAANPTEAREIGHQYGITQEQIKMLMIKAPPQTNLGKYIAKLKIQQEKAKARSTPADTTLDDTPEQFEQDEEPVTNNSDSLLDDDLKRVLGVNQ